MLEGLIAPGRRLIFIDETGTPGKPLDRLARDFQLFCGVSLHPGCYAKVRDEIREWLARLDGPAEFHATEIVNGKHGSAWRNLPMADRLASLRFLSKLLLESCDQILFCYVSGEQFPQLLAEAQKEVSLSVSQKKGLRMAFFGRLLELVTPMPDGSGGVAVVTDADEPMRDRIKIESRPDTESLYEGGIIHACSTAVEGLQVADFAAYVLNRVSHSLERASQAKFNEFDEIITSTFVELQPRCLDLLGPEVRG